MAKLSKILYLCIFSWFTIGNAANIIFDLNGVLVEKSSWQACRQIGLTNFLGFYNPFTLEKTLFELLDKLDPRNPETPHAKHGELLLPQIFCDWLSGTKTSEEIKTLAHQKIKQHKNLFSSKGHRKLILEMINTIFTPDKFANTIVPVKKGFKLLKKCRNYRDEQGNRHKIFILSNWDKESFELLAKTNKKIQKLLLWCDGIIISGDIGFIKPDPRIFHYLFDAYEIDPDTELTIFIDDQRENIQAALALNKKQLYAFQCKNCSFKNIKKELRNLHIIN